jgi:hypothetical protein
MSPKFENQKDVLAFLTGIIHKIHDQGFFISGSISIDNAMPCTRCRCQMKLVLTDQVNGIYQRKCPKCDDAGGSHVRVIPVTGPPMPLIDQVSANFARALAEQVDKQILKSSDAAICAKCGGIARRSGTCYTCTVCGETSGCS